MRRVYLLMAVMTVGICAGDELPNYISSDPFDLNENDKIDTIDFGFIPFSGTIGDRVWKDVNGDGIQDLDTTKEPGIEGVTVKLLDFESGTCIQTTTDANGIYLFTGLKPGKYQVVVDTSALVDDYNKPSPPYAVSDNSIDSDTVNPSETDPCA